MSINKINLDYFISKDDNEEVDNIIFSYENSQWISFIKNNKFLSWEYFGFMIIKCQNTNKAIKELLYNEKYLTNIKINDKSISLSDIVVVSPFSRISDVLSDRTNGNLHNYLKEFDSHKIKLDIENYIVSKLDNFKDDIEELIEYDFSKSDPINFVDIRDDFIDKSNFKKILNVLKSYNQKKLIILNDVDYIDFNDITMYFQFFDFLFFVNDHENYFTKIEDYETLLIEYDYI